MVSDEHAHPKLAPEDRSTSALHVFGRDRSVITLVILRHVARQIEWTKDLTKVGLYWTTSKLSAWAGLAKWAFAACFVRLVAFHGVVIGCGWYGLIDFG
jgi:hypothetical protein